MDILIKLVGVLGGIYTVKGLISVFTGWGEFADGRKADNPSKMNSGIEAMVFGGITASISAAITATIVASIMGVKF